MPKTKQENSGVSFFSFPSGVWSTIFSNFTLRELIPLRRVSKSLKEIVEKDDKWIKELKSINEENAQAFYDAIHVNDIEKIKRLLSKELFNVNLTMSVRFESLKESGSKVTLIFYAAIMNKIEIVQLLLEHGADPTKKVNWSYGYKGVKKVIDGYSYAPNNNNQQNRKISILESDFEMSTELKSLICIGYMEHHLAKNEIPMALNYFDLSYNHDKEYTKKYLEKIHRDKKGITFLYENKEVKGDHENQFLQVLQSRFDLCSNEPEESVGKCCLVS